MIGTRLRQSTGAMGVELGASGVRLVQFGRGGEVAAAGEAELDAAIPTDQPVYHEAVERALGELIDRVAPAGRRIVTALPTEAMHVQNVRLPMMPEAELAEAVRWEVSEADGPPREVRHLNAGEIRHGEQGRLELIAMSVDASYLDAHVAMLDRLKLVPEAIDVVPAALARAVVGDERTAMIADVDHHATRVVIARQGEVAFFKIIPIGLSALRSGVVPTRTPGRMEPEPHGLTAPAAVSALAQEPTTGPAAELAGELALCLRYYSVTFRGQRPDRVVLAGAGAQDAALTSALAQQMNLDVELASPAGTLGPAWAVAVGLAQRTATEQRQERAA